MLKELPQYQTASDLDDRVFAATVPPDHYLRRVQQAIDFESCRSLMVSAYAGTMGRPAIEPVLLLKLEFLQYHYNLSDRQVVEQAQYNMAFRWFLGLSLDSELPHHTLLTHFRQRLGAERHQAIFDAIVGQAREHGLIKDRLRLKDATHVLANIAIPSTIALVSQTRDRLLTALAFWAPERVASERRRVETLRKATADLSGEERLLQRVTHLRSLVAWAEAIPATAAFTAAPPSAQQALQDALTLAQKVLANRNDPDGPDHLVSPHDPDARWAKHGVYYAGYLLDVIIDADSELVTALNVIPPHGTEAFDAVALLAREEQAHGNDVQALSMDTAGFHGPTLHALTAIQGKDVYVPPKAMPASDYFRPEQFTLDPKRQTLTCPGGQTTTHRRRSWRNGGWSYRFARSTCADCALQAQCLPALPSKSGRVVIKNDHEPEYQTARAKVGTATYEAVRREHGAVERKLGEMVRWHRGRRARYRGRWKVWLQELMTGIVVNVKRIVLLTDRLRSRAGHHLGSVLATSG
jgi:transposase